MMKPGEVKTFIVDEEHAGGRVDKFLASRIMRFSRTEIQKFDVNRKMSDKVKAGEEIKIVLPLIVDQPSPPAFLCKDGGGLSLNLDIIYEDADIIVVNKPRGIVMYPAAGNASGTLVQAVLAHADLSRMGESNRPGVVHRIDKDTSGAVILAKTDAAFRELVKKFSGHDLVRKYVAFVWGIPNWPAADIIGNIGRSVKNRQKMALLKIGGRPAKTHVDLIRAWTDSGISQVRCTLETGRTHQIRVHLSTHGFGVVCDPLYGRGKIGSVKNPAVSEFVRTHSGQMLHAEILELAHPITGEKIKFRAPLPDDMRELLAALG